LAIASCGNAALGAAVVAKAANWPLDVFVPEGGSENVVDALNTLGATVHLCARQTGVVGDPCYHAFQAAVRTGSIPFSVQGNENGLVVEAGRVLGYELIDQLPPTDAPRSMVIQVGGGALASGCFQAWNEAHEAGAVAQLPQLNTVQTEAAHPLKRAHDRFMEDLRDERLGVVRVRLRSQRSRYMWPWEETPESLAHGILDDETYDWRVLVELMQLSGGQTILVTEAEIREANEIARRSDAATVCPTGSAGLAGVTKLVTTRGAGPPAQWIVVFTGADR
jgi:threonine synthase